MTDVTTRFLKYVSFDTTSDPDSPTLPSTSIQFALANYLKEECIQMGLSNVRVSDTCFFYATLPAHTDKDIPSL